MRSCILALLILFAVSLNAQEDFKPLQSEGQIPESILELAKDGYAKDRKQISSSERLTYVREDEFYKKMNFSISRLMKNGQVLFGNEVSTYVNDVAAKIFEIVPEMKDEVEFFVIKDSEVNAYASQKGIIFVNIGLIAQIENEAQLAYVMIHELVHYMEKHGVKGYVKKEALKNRDYQYRGLSLEQRVNEYTDYSKEFEFEADTKCLKDIYLKMGYDIDEALKVFDVLLYSYLPFDEMKFDLEHFDDEDFKLSTDYYLEEPNAITAVEDYDDTYSLHPNIKKRRENIYEVVADLDVENEKKKFLLDETRFNRVQKMSRYELCQLYVDDMDYGKALYSTYMLMKSDSTSNFLNRMYTYSLYALSKYYNNQQGKSEESSSSTYYVSGKKVTVNVEEDESSNTVLLDPDETEGQSSMLYHLIAKMPANELNVVAVRELCKAMIQFPEDKFLRMIAEDAIVGLHEYHELKLEDFTEENFKDTATFVELTDEEYEELTKYEKIRYDKKLKSIKEKKEETFLGNALLAYIENDIVKDVFKNAEEEIEKRKKQREAEDEEEVYYYNVSNLDGHYKPDPSLSIDKVVVVNPVYNTYRKNDYKYLKSEESEIDMLKHMTNMSRKAGVDVELLDVYRFGSRDIDRYNDLSILMRYYIEFFAHQMILDDDEIVGANLMYMDDLRDKYNTDYFSISYVQSSVAPRDDVGFVLFYSLFLVFPAPYGIYYAVTPEKEVEYLNVVLDAKTGKIVYGDIESISSRDYNYLIKSLMYNSYFFMKQSK